jgi:HK97 family phage major capsid protein
MALNTTSEAPLLTPAQVADLLVEPVTQQSVATQVSTLVSTSSHDFRVPAVTTDPSASWVAEGAEISPSDMTLAEVTVTPSKVAGLSIISNELATDSSPAAANAVGSGLARDIARQVDNAFFGDLASPAPAGLRSLTNTGTVTVGDTAGSGAWVDLDPFLEAISDAAQLGADVTAFVTNPSDALALAKLKEASGSNRTLLQPDPSSATGRVIAGVPMYTSPAVPAGVCWALPQQRVYVVVRQDATVDTDGSVFFTSDRVAVRAVMRVGFGYPQPAALVKIALA